ncbi:MAG: rhs element Vgr protein [Pedobacter sp.]|nr:MAG: rhs element Vgr protein [Pedobacter sp.]
MAQQVKADIVIGGKKLEHFTHLQINQSLFTHHTFEIAVPFEVLENKDDFFFKQSHTAMVGEVATISFKTVYKNVPADFKFLGIVTELTLVNDSDMINSFVISGQSPTCLMEDGVQRRAWVDQPFPNIINAILKDYSSFNKTVNVVFTEKISYKAQYDESNWDYLTRLCDEYGEWCYYDGTKLVVGKAVHPEQPFVTDGIQHFSMSIGVKPNQVEMMHYNYQKHERYTGKGLPVSGLGTFGDFAYSKSSSLFAQASQQWPLRDVQFKAQLDDAVEAINKGSATNLVKFNGAGENPNLGVGVVVDVTARKLDVAETNKFKEESAGKYRINSITHTVDEVGNYSNDFEAVPFSVSTPPLNPFIVSPTALPEVATVKFNEDPLKLGRVKVEFHWPNVLMAKSNWIRVAVPYTGGARGSLYIPEIEDQVMISYEANHVDFPVVIGSLYHKDPSTNYWFDNNYQKIIRTKGGNKIVMKDKPGEQEFFITNSNNKDTGLHISFKDDGVVHIYTKGLIQLDAKDIKMHATNNVEITADNEMHLHGQTKVNVTGNEFNVKGDSIVDITAPNVDVYE